MAKKAEPIFTKEQLDTLQGSIYIAWNAIGMDMDWTGIRSSQRNAVAIESSIDADRMVMFDDRKGKESQQILRDGITKHGYDKVFKFLVKNISLE